MQFGVQDSRIGRSRLRLATNQSRWHDNFHNQQDALYTEFARVRAQRPRQKSLIRLHRDDLKDLLPRAWTHLEFPKAIRPARLLTETVAEDQSRCCYPVSFDLIQYPLKNAFGLHCLQFIVF
jgi:hypothetical protein